MDDQTGANGFAQYTSDPQSFSMDKAEVKVSGLEENEVKPGELSGCSSNTESAVEEEPDVKIPPLMSCDDGNHDFLQPSLAPINVITVPSQVGTSTASKVAGGACKATSSKSLNESLKNYFHGDDMNKAMEAFNACLSKMSAQQKCQSFLDQCQKELADADSPQDYSLHLTRNVPDSGGEGENEELREQDRFLPIANVARIMKNAIPASGKIAKDAKECVQECVSEFISFITSEASERCQQEKRKTINGEDILFAMSQLGFDNYIEPLKVYLQKYRDSIKGDKTLEQQAEIRVQDMGEASEATVLGGTLSMDGGQPTIIYTTNYQPGVQFQ